MRDAKPLQRQRPSERQLWVQKPAVIPASSELAETEAPRRCGRIRGDIAVSARDGRMRRQVEPFDLDDQPMATCSTTAPWPDTHLASSSSVLGRRD